MLVLGIGGSFQYGIQLSLIVSPAEVRADEMHSITLRLASCTHVYVLDLCFILSTTQSVTWFFVISPVWPTNGLKKLENVQKGKKKKKSKFLIFLSMSIRLLRSKIFSFDFHQCWSVLPLTSETFPQHIQSFVNFTWILRYGTPVAESTNQLIWSFIVALMSLGAWAGAIHSGSLPVTYGRWDNKTPPHMHMSLYFDTYLNIVWTSNHFL